MAKNSVKPGKIGFYLFGLFEIFIGLIFLLIAIGSLFIPKIAPPNPQFPTPNFLPLSLFAFLFSSFVITMGVGTFMAKRWARKVMLILSWYGLFAGLFALVFLVFFMGSFFNNALSPAQLSPAVINGMKTGMIAATSIFYILLPGLFVLFYQSKGVLAGVEFYDPKENWMDACPTPVFAVSLFAAFGVVGVSLFLTMVAGFNFPFSGFGMVPVWAMALIPVAVIAALAYISIGFYHLEPKAWWAALALVIIISIALTVFYKTMDPTSMYQNMKVPQAQIDQMNKSGMLDMLKSFSNFGWIMSIPYLAYLLFVRKYFYKK